MDGEEKGDGGSVVEKVAAVLWGAWGAQRIIAAKNALALSSCTMHSYAFGLEEAPQRASGLRWESVVRLLGHMLRDRLKSGLLFPSALGWHLV